MERNYKHSEQQFAQLDVVTIKMATAPQRTFTSLIECPVCMEDMGPHNKPKVLPCQHTVCEKCITGIDQQCPLCRLSFPRNSSENLPTNLTNLQLGDIIRERNLESNRNLCDYCQEDPQVITHYCKDCADYLCSKCVQYHSEVFDDHLPEPIASNVCIKHMRAYTMFCLDCHILLCTVCVQHHVCCNNRNKTKIQDINVQNIQDLIKLTERISSEIQYNNENVMYSKANTTLNDRLDIIEEIRQNVRTHMQNLQARLKERENELMEEINKYESEVLEIQSSIDLGTDIDRLSQLKETAKAALAGGIEQILLTLPTIHAALTQTASKRDKAVIIPRKLTFNPEESLQVGNLHKDPNEVFNSRDLGHKHACNIKTVSVTDERSGIGKSLWDGVFVKKSVLAITDCKENAILLVDSQGHILTDSQKQGVVLHHPCGIAYHPTLHCLVVCDSGAHCLCVLDSSTLSLTKKVQLAHFSPHGVAVMSNGNIVLTDSNNKKVGVFDMNGTQLYSWDTYNNGASRFRCPWYVTVDRDNNIYVADFLDMTIVKFNETGAMLSEWQTKSEPHGLTVCGDKVLVAEHGPPHRVREYSVKGGPGRRLLKWHREEGFERIMSVAIHHEQLVVIGQQGLRLYKLTYK